MRYHIYWQDKILLKDLDEEEFRNIWEKMHWVYNNELNYVTSREFNEPVGVQVGGETLHCPVFSHRVVVAPLSL